MTRLLRIHSLVAAAGLLTAAACDRDPETQQRVDRAGDEVRDQTGQLRESAQDVTDSARDEADELGARTREPPEGARATVPGAIDETGQRLEPGDATGELEQRKLARVETLRAVHGVAASQPMLINAAAQIAPLTAAGQAEVSDKLQALQQQLDEAENAIQTLQAADATTWEDGHGKAEQAMQRLEEARAAAWQQLDDADRLAPVSMR